MNRRKPITVEIAGETYSAALLTLGMSRALASDIRVLQDAMLKQIRGESFTAEEDSSYKSASITVVSAVLSVNHPECSPEWVADNVLPWESGEILGKVWRASLPPSRDVGSPQTQSPQP